MNDGDLLKPSIQLPKDTARPPQHLHGRNKAITLLNRAMHYAHTPTRERTPHEYTDETTKHAHRQTLVCVCRK